MGYHGSALSASLDPRPITLLAQSPWSSDPATAALASTLRGFDLDSIPTSTATVTDASVFGLQLLAQAPRPPGAVTHYLGRRFRRCPAASYVDYVYRGVRYYDYYA